MSEFEKWFADQDFYTNMRFIHGDALFTKDGDVYRVLPVLIAFESWFASACTSIDHIHRLQHEKAKQQSEIDQLKAEFAELVSLVEGDFDTTTELSCMVLALIKERDQLKAKSEIKNEKIMKLVSIFTCLSSQILCEEPELSDEFYVKFDEFHSVLINIEL